MGEIGKDGRVLIIRRIDVTYHLTGVAGDQREVVERVHEFHADHCPVARSIRDSIEITTRCDLVD